MSLILYYQLMRAWLHPDEDCSIHCDKHYCKSFARTLRFRRERTFQPWNSVRMEGIMYCVLCVRLRDPYRQHVIEDIIQLGISNVSRCRLHSQPTFIHPYIVSFQLQFSLQPVGYKLQPSSDAIVKDFYYLERLGTQTVCYCQTALLPREL